MKEHFGHIADFYSLSLAHRYAIEKNYPYCLIGLNSIAEFQNITPLEVTVMFTTFCQIHGNKPLTFGHYWKPAKFRGLG